MTDLIIITIIAGICGTIAMDLLNLVFARMGILLKIDVPAIGRMAAGWTHGWFRYTDPAQMQPARHETLTGYGAHYAIGLAFAVPYIFGWPLLFGRSLLYGEPAPVRRRMTMWLVENCIGKNKNRIPSRPGGSRNDNY